MISDGKYLLLTLAAAGAAAWVADKVAAVALADGAALLGPAGQDLVAQAVLTPAWDPSGRLASMIAAGIVVLASMQNFSTRRERALKREVRGKEYGGAEWASDDEIAAYAHTAESRVVRATLPRDRRELREAIRRDWLLPLKAMLGLSVRVATPKPEWCQRIEDDNVILSTRVAKSLSYIPDERYNRNNHILVIGGTGTGKTRRFVIPNLLQLAGSYVLTDPKGDTCWKVAPFLKAHGYRVVIVDVKLDELRFSARYNPLLHLTNATSAMVLGDLFVQNTTDAEGGGGGNADFFIKAEKQLYYCLFLYVHLKWARSHPEWCTFDTVIKLLQQAKEGSDSKGGSVLDRIILGGPEGSKTPSFRHELIGRYGSESAASASDEWAVITYYRGFKSTAGSPETEASVLSSCNVRLARLIAGDVKRFFSGDELGIDRIGEEPTALFLTMSDSNSTFYFILTLLLYQFFDINTAIADRQAGSHCKIPVYCVLDELANIGKIPDLDQKIATLRSRWIHLYPILQDSGQLKKWYKDAAGEIEKNCSTTLYLGGSDVETCEKISKTCGKRTIVVESKTETKGSHGSYSVSTQKVAKDLISASDLMSNPDEFGADACIVLIKNAHPVLDKKYDYTTHPRYAELCATAHLTPAEYGSKLESLRRASISCEARLSPVMGGSPSDIRLELLDTVSFEGLVPGRRYALSVRAVGTRDGVVVCELGSDSEVVPDSPRGNVDVHLAIPAGGTVRGASFALHEELSYEGIAWARHSTPAADRVLVPTIVRGAGGAKVSSTSVRLAASQGPDGLPADGLYVDALLTGLIPNRAYTLSIDLLSSTGARIAGSTRAIAARGTELLVQETYSELDLEGVGSEWDVRCLATVTAGAAYVDGGTLTCVTNAAALQPGQGYECHLIQPIPALGQGARKCLAETEFAQDQQVAFRIDSEQTDVSGGTIGVALALSGVEVGELCQPDLDDAADAVTVPISWGHSGIFTGESGITSESRRLALAWDDEERCAVLTYDATVPEDASALPVTISITPHIRNVDGTDITDTDQARSTTEERCLEPGESAQIRCLLAKGFVEASRGLRIVPIVRATTAVAVDYFERQIAKVDRQGGGRRQAPRAQARQG